MPDSPLLRGGAGTSGPDAYRAVCAKAADGMREADAFGEPEQWRFGWDRPYTRGEWLDQLPTSGFWAQIPAAGQREIDTFLRAREELQRRLAGLALPDVIDLIREDRDR